MLFVVVGSPVYHRLRLSGGIVVSVNKQPGKKEGEYDKGSNRNADNQGDFGIVGEPATARGNIRGGDI